VPSPWSAEQIVALAPDAASVSAARALSSPAPWSRTGVAESPAAVWGLCRGTGKNPYQTVVDLAGPAYRCSGPSRKFPCKHALGLLLLWSLGGVGASEVPDWAETWLAERAERAAKPAAVEKDPPAADPEAARRRAGQRAARVTEGLDELDRWLADQVRTGLVGAERGGYAHFEQVAARMVDAQAPAVASALRRLPWVAAGGEGRHGRLLEELAALRLVVVAHRRLGALPAPLAATVRARVGYPVPREEVLAEPGVADEWAVLGMYDSADERLTTRRIWLRGRRTERVALVLSFAPAGRTLDMTLVPGTAREAVLHFYPGAAPLRALVGETRGEPEPLTALPGGDIAEACARLGAAVAADPWIGEWPVVLSGVVPVPGEPGWTLLDGAGSTLSVGTSTADLWRLLAVSGGRPVDLAGVLTHRGIRPLSAAAPDSGLVLL
jgi:hypothetical protein